MTQSPASPFPKGRKGAHRHVKFCAKGPIIPPRCDNGSPVGRAISSLAPWPPQGRREIVLALLPHNRTWAAVQSWRSGRNRIPPGDAEAIAAALEARARDDLTTATALREGAKEQRSKLRRLTGFFEVDRQKDEELRLLRGVRPR